jgi:hypothetical protein
VPSFRFIYYGFNCEILLIVFSLWSRSFDKIWGRGKEFNKRFASRMNTSLESSKKFSYCRNFPWSYLISCFLG